MGDRVLKKQLITYVKKWKEVGAISMVAAVALSITTDSIKEGFDQSVFFRLMIFLIVIGVLYALAWYFTRPYKITTQLATQNNAIPQCKVVVTALSPLNPGDKNIDVITNLIHHHAEKLETLVLVCTPDHEGVQNALNVLRGWLEQTYHENRRLLPDQLLEIAAVKATSEIADIFGILTDKIGFLEARKQITAADVYVDVTAGFKTFSIALMLVAREYNYFLSYQIAPRGDDGKPSGPAQLTLLKFDQSLIHQTTT